MTGGRPETRTAVSFHLRVGSRSFGSGQVLVVGVPTPSGTMRPYDVFMPLLLLLGDFASSFVAPSITSEPHRLGSIRLFSTPPSKPKVKRRQRRNKYEKFSRVQEKDPLEQLLEESARKNQEIEDRSTPVTQRPSAEPLDLPLVSYPDTQSIDPYDPQTFGYILIGTIQNAHGVHGWLKVASKSSSSSCDPGLVYLKPARKRAPRPIRLRQGKQVDATMHLVELEGITSREEAQQLRGAALYIREEQIAEEDEDATPDEYVVSELVGLDVFMEEDTSQFVGNVVGVVFAEDISSIPGFGHDYLEVSLPRGVGGTASFKDELVLIPMVPQIVPRIELKKEKAVYIDPPEGLLDLKYVRHEKTRIKGFLPSNDSDTSNGMRA